MSNHYHLMLRTPQCDLDHFMYVFNKSFSDLLRQQSGQINRMFGGRYRWSLIDHQKYLLSVFRYVYQNPVRANLCQKCEQYPYSSLFYCFENRVLDLKMVELFSLTPELMTFLNTPSELVKDVAIRKGLHKGRFKEVVPRPN